MVPATFNGDAGLHGRTTARARRFQACNADDVHAVNARKEPRFPAFRARSVVASIDCAGAAWT
jgi:hypothetical protein